jgi:hypothetical protein
MTLILRAGCNFSAISGTDPNALKWDRAGYAHLARLASRNPEESFVQRTPSIEFWDSHVPHDKISTMAEYLEDVCLVTPDACLASFVAPQLMPDSSRQFKVLPLSELPAGTKYATSQEQSSREHDIDVG